MKPPKRLKGEARRKWVEVFGDLSELSPLELELSCQYCEAFALYLTAKRTWEEEGITKTGGKNGAPYQHPAVGAMNKAQETMERIYKLLVNKTAAPKDEEDLV